jgi:hypothetical protein
MDAFSKMGDRQDSKIFHAVEAPPMGKEAARAICGGVWG